jgi:LAO/AO transport system kinase
VSNEYDILDNIQAGNYRLLARAITIVENELDGYEQLLQRTDEGHTTPVIGITGAPGAGKSTLTDHLIGEFIQGGNTVAVLCTDPSSPYTHGAILGDRVRMSQWYNHPSVFIRSLGSRGALGGLPVQADAILSLLKLAPFDVIIVETVGVGQNEVGIASLADCTVVVMVPEGGDEIQLMKAGLMEIGDIYVVNKSDRPGADQLASDLRQMLRELPGARDRSVVKTSANTRTGIGELVSTIKKKIILDNP